MQAVEFVTKAHDGVVDLPREFQDWNGKPARVILLEETTGSQSISQGTAANVWAKYSQCLARRAFGSRAAGRV